jgi:hypothetical protein
LFLSFSHFENLFISFAFCQRDQKKAVFFNLSNLLLCSEGLLKEDEKFR